MKRRRGTWKEERRKEGRKEERRKEERRKGGRRGETSLRALLLGGPT